MAQLKSSVFVDATTLRGLSGMRGIGRYVRDLLGGLASIADTEAPDLTFHAVTDVTPRGLAVTRDLRAAAEDVAEKRSTGQAGVPLGRRTLLAPLRSRAGADLLHLAEIRGTPIIRPIPLIVTCYDLIPLRFPREYLGKAFVGERYPTLSPGYLVRHLKDLRRYRSAARVVCISERTRADLLDLLPIAPHRVEVVRTGLSLARYAELGPSTVGERPRPFAIFVGHADWRKNVPMMFETLRRANERTAIDLLWVGGLKANDLAAMHALAAIHGVTDRVVFTGYVDVAGLARLYHDAVALLFLSRLEGFGLPVLEAMAAGCPAIVARGSASDEVAGEAGIIVDADDPDAAATQLVRLAASPDERAALSASGLARAPLYTRAPTPSASMTCGKTRHLTQSPSASPAHCATVL